MLDLTTLWAKRLKLIAANLKYGEREHREVAVTAQHVRLDYHGRFLIELIQNAADQAIRAKMKDSKIVIVRTEGMLAVLNQGRPLDDDGFRALTSLSYDTKDPALTIGNKGLGFKSVFQVSDAPEVYSAPLTGGGIVAEGGYRFAFNSRPFKDPALLHQLHEIAEDFAREEAQAVREICSRHGADSFAELLLREATESAPFRFPLPRDYTALLERGRELGLGEEKLQSASALVVLPVRANPDAQGWIDSAMLELFRDSRGAAVLFLEGVGEIRYEDRRNGTWRAISRKEHDSPVVRPGGPGHGRVSRYATTLTTADAEGPRATSCDWWLCSRTLGHDADSDPTTAAEERRQILGAVADFPGEHWSKVDHATVDVAVPIPAGRDTDGLLGTDGVFCIGLPSEMATGMPIWVNARFHGSIARTEIDFEQNGYNRLLFTEALELVSDLVEALKTAEDLNSRRLATLALEANPNSVLAAALGGPEGLLSRDIVLAADGATHMRGQSVLLPKAQDESIFWLLSNQGAKPGSQFALPDAWLMRNARSLLLQLGASEGPASGPDRRYLERDESGLSLLERGAQTHRKEGVDFWEPFVRWMLDRYPADLIAGQRVLPTGNETLSSAADRVYAAPILPESALEGREAGDPERLDRVIEASLALFDERCVRLREGEGAKYTSLGNRLRQADPPLVREPELADLVREVFGPRIQEITAVPGNEEVAIALLRVIAEWAQARDIKDLPLNAIRVPCQQIDGPEWEWFSPVRVYQGPGWQDPYTDALLFGAYGGTQGRLMVPWSQFASAARSQEVDKEWWGSALQVLGVRPSPRVLRYSHTAAPLQAISYAGPLYRVPGSRCPAAIASIQDRWDHYIESIRWRKASVTSGQTYDVEALSWIDGLETEASRTDVVALMITRHEFYERHLTTRLSRAQGRGDATEVPAFWVHALRESEWPTIPTSHGLVPCKQAWLLIGEQRRQRNERYRFLPCVVAAAEPAHNLLRALGVATTDEAEPLRYVRALHSIAARLVDMRSDDMPDAVILVEELYRNLQARLAAGPVEIPELLDGPMPMFDGIDARRLRAVDLNEPGTILVDDDPVRSRFVINARASAVLPVMPRRGYRALVSALEGELGEGAISYTSSAPVDVGFTPGPSPDTSLATFLERAYPEKPWRRDVALLLESASPGISQERVRTDLSRYDETRLRFGSFDAGSGAVSFLNEERDVPPSLLVSEELRPKPDEVFAATWELVGAHRDLWAAYATALRDGSTERFLRERGISPADVRAAEENVNPARAGRFDAIKALVLAVALDRGVAADVARFNSEWATRATNVDALAGWIGRPEIADYLATAVAPHDAEQAMLHALEAADVEISRWQEARELLQLAPYEFARSRAAIERAKETVVAALMATAAHALSVDLATARAVLDNVRASAPSPDVLRLPCHGPQAVAHVVRFVQNAIADLENASIGVLAARVDEALALPEDRIEEALLTRVPRREVDEYRLPETSRSETSTRDVGIVMEAARRLAGLFGETLESASVEHHGRVAALTSGWWANRFAVLAALRQALEQAVPRTTLRLSEVRAFHDPGPPGALLARLDELAVTPAEPEAPAPPRQIDIASISVSRPELDPDVARGSDGQVGAELRRHVQENLDFATLRLARRPTPQARGRRGGWSGRTSRTSYQEIQDERDINGLLGEAFVYEQFREVLPGFDFRCWRSTNAVRYGVAANGDDGLGADMIYQDVSGVLTGRDDAPEVYIEVKATSDDGAAPFEMTDAEWETALRMHLEGRRQAYVIVRVAQVRSAPSVYRIFSDPIRLSSEGLLIVEASDRRVRGA